MTLKHFQLLMDRHTLAEEKIDKRLGVEWKEIETATNEDEMFQTMMQFTEKRKLLPS